MLRTSAILKILEYLRIFPIFISILSMCIYFRLPKQLFKDVFETVVLRWFSLFSRNFYEWLFQVWSSSCFIFQRKSLDCSTRVMCIIMAFTCISNLLAMRPVMVIGLLKSSSIRNHWVNIFKIVLNKIN